MPWTGESVMRREESSSTSSSEVVCSRVAYACRLDGKDMLHIRDVDERGERVLGPSVVRSCSAVSCTMIQMYRVV